MSKGNKKAKTKNRRCTFYHKNPFLSCMILPTEGDNRKEKEQELKTLMKRLEAKYAALQVVPVISKLGSPQVGALCVLKPSVL